MPNPSSIAMEEEWAKPVVAESERDKIMPADCACAYPCSCVKFNGVIYKTLGDVVRHLIADRDSWKHLCHLTRERADRYLEELEALKGNN